MAFLEALPLLCESRASLNPQSLVQQTGREEPEQKAPVARGTLGGAGREAEAWLPLAPCLPPTYKPRMGKHAPPKSVWGSTAGARRAKRGFWPAATTAAWHWQYPPLRPACSITVDCRTLLSYRHTAKQETAQRSQTLTHFQIQDESVLTTSFSYKNGG